jgi:hypothetical protein
MPKPDDPLEYNPEKIDSERQMTLLQRGMFDRESLDELLKIVNTQPKMEN